MDKLFCQALCRNRSIHYFVSALRNPVVWIVVLNSLSLPNINHEALINKLNIRTLERKFVYFPIRKNNTYQVVFIRAQRYFHSLSLNVLADKHVGFKRGKTPLSFKQFYYRFFIWFKKHVFLKLPFKGWRSEIHLFFEETFTFRKHPSLNFSILIRPRPRCTYQIVLFEFGVKLPYKLWVPHWAPVKFFLQLAILITRAPLLKGNLNGVNYSP